MRDSPAVTPGGLAPRQQVQAWQRLEVQRWHAIVVSEDSRSGVPYLRGVRAPRLTGTVVQDRLSPDTPQVPVVRPAFTIACLLLLGARPASAQEPAHSPLRASAPAVAALDALRPPAPVAPAFAGDTRMNWNKVAIATVIGTAAGAALFAFLQNATYSPEGGPEYVVAGGLLGAVVGFFVGLSWGSE
jgi:hypothetical protein